jgi:hypothetical protein
MISAKLQERIRAEAFRCPSVHNVQPWLLAIKADHFVIYDDLQRSLSIGDAQLHDHEVSIGAFIEGLNLLLGTEGLAVDEIVSLAETPRPFKDRTIRERYRLTLKKGAVADPLADEISRRHSYRGVFPKSTELDKSRLAKIFDEKLFAVISAPDQLFAWAKAYDECAVRINAEPAYQAELYHWLRLRDSHPNYQMDGLNREALSLAPIEGRIANFLMRPSVYQNLNRFGLAKLVISEAPQIRSATGLLFLFKVPGESPLQAGRRFYRAWLELSRQGFSACPLSSLVDDRTARVKIEATFPGKIPFNVLRVGIAPPEKVYKSARLSPEDQIVEEQSHEE